MFYDYSKHPTRHKLPKNYHLTFSYSGAKSFTPIVDKWFNKRTNQNIAVVFESKHMRNFEPQHNGDMKDCIGCSYGNAPVINGDSTDLRFLDPDNVVVGLTAKGKAKTDTTGFVVRAV